MKTLWQYKQLQASWRCQKKMSITVEQVCVGYMKMVNILKRFLEGGELQTGTYTWLPWEKYCLILLLLGTVIILKQYTSTCKKWKSYKATILMFMMPLRGHHVVRRWFNHWTSSSIKSTGGLTRERHFRSTKGGLRLCLLALKSTTLCKNSLDHLIIQVHSIV